MKRLGALALVVALFAFVWASGGTDTLLRAADEVGLGEPAREALEIAGASGGNSGTSAPGPDSSTAVGTSIPSSPEQARQMLDELTVAPAGSMSGYSREEFPHWAADAEEHGWREPDESCDVRDAALIRDGRGVEIDEDCGFTAGEWLDPYTGQTLADSSEVDIDHVVPLANAWRSGANEWSTGERESYANGSYEVLSVDDGANQAKGDKGPEAWRPPNADYHCEYAYRWIAVKTSWSMTVSAAEKAALEEMLGTCPEGE